MNQSVLCECVGWKHSLSNIKGIEQHSFILDLCIVDTGEMLVKYLNCNSTTQNRFTVPQNGDFAKLYRLTLGSNPTKRFSEAGKLVSHFLGCRFFAEYKKTIAKNKIVYSKVISLRPEKPILNDSWTSTGMVKKTHKGGHKTEEYQRKSSGLLADKQRIFSGKVADCKSLQASKSLGLEPVFNHVQSPEPISKKVQRELVPRTNFFNYSRFENETIEDFHNRVIDESFISSW